MQTMTDNNVPNDLVTLEEAAQVLGVSPRTVRLYVERGKLPGYRKILGRSALMISRRDLEQVQRFIPYDQDE